LFERACRSRRRFRCPGIRLPGCAEDLVYVEHVTVIALRTAVADHDLDRLAVERSEGVDGAAGIGGGTHGSTEFTVLLHGSAASRRTPARLKGNDILTLHPIDCSRRRSADTGLGKRGKS